MQLLGLELPLT
jgi:hypothetical protein